MAPYSETPKVKEEAELEPAQIQDLSEIMPKLLAIKAKADIPIQIYVQIRMGDGKIRPPAEVIQEVNALLEDVKKGFRLK